MWQYTTTESGSRRWLNKCSYSIYKAASQVFRLQNYPYIEMRAWGSVVVNPFEHSVVCDATGLAKSVQYAVVCETVDTSMSFACNSSFLSVDGMTCLISSER